MYIRVKSTPNSPRKSIQIVESIRDGEKVKQKIVHYVGIALDDREEQKLKDYGETLIAKITVERAQKSQQASLLPLSEQEVKEFNNKRGRPRRKNIEDIIPAEEVKLGEIKEQARITEGVHEVAGIVFDDIYPKLLEEKRAQQCLKDLVLARLVTPASKHKTQKNLAKQFDKEYSLDFIYRIMDKLFQCIPAMKKMTFEKTRSLFPEQVDLLLFDVTTLYFESTEVDELRNFGYSKDNRFNTTQVVLALATNQDGLPVGYELFEGNKAEVATLVAAIESWKRLFRIQSVCFVGDRAMFTKANIDLLESLHYHYIIAAKLKTLPRGLQQQLFDEQRYQPTMLKNELAWIGEFEHLGQRLVVSYKSRRALKDQRDRQHILEKIKKYLGKKGSASNLITNQGVKKFIVVNDATVSLDENKIENAAQWDGLHGIITNIRDDAPESLISRYAKLWVIEESFRINKHNLKMRPIFHWKPERIHAHIAICYMAFSVLRHLQYRVNLTQKLSIDSILDELLNVQASIFVHKRTKDRYRVPGSFSNEARKIYKAFSIDRSLDATIYWT